MKDFTEKEMDEFTTIMDEIGVVTWTWSQMQDIAKCMKTYHLKKLEEKETKEKALKWYNQLTDEALDQVQKKTQRNK